MRILIIANNDVGLYRFRKELIQKLIEDGNDVHISLPYGNLVGELVKAGCTYIETLVDRRGLNPAKDLKLLFSYAKLVKSVKPDLVITYTIKPNIYGGFVCRMLRIPYAVNITGLGTAFQKDGFLRKLVTFMYKVSINKAKVVFFENVGNMQLFATEKIIHQSQACVLNGAGVNLSDFPYQKYPEDSERMRFLFAGRVMQEKGVNELIAAMRALRAEGLNCTVDVVGGCEENYQNVIQQCEMEGWLQYYGYQPDVRPFVTASHCVVLPSWHEGMANTNLEAASMGRPIITSNIHGCKEAVLENESGYLCEAGNWESVYKAMKKMAAMSTEEREDMGVSGRKHMEAIFDKNIVVKKTINRLLKEEIAV